MEVINKNIKLSIVIPAFNVENYLEECVISVLHQGLSESEYEIIIINDGSTDNTLSIANRLKESYSVIKVFSQINKGQSYSRNFGIKKSKGQYLYFIDSDDFLDAGYLNIFLDLAIKSHYDFVGFQYKRHSERLNLNNNIEPLIVECEGTGIEMIANYNYNNGACYYLVKKTLLANHRFIEGRLAEDSMFTAGLFLLVRKGIMFKNKIYNYYINENSIVKTKDPNRLFKLCLDMFFAAYKFNEIINELPKETEMYEKAFFSSET